MTKKQYIIIGIISAIVSGIFMYLTKYFYMVKRRETNKYAHCKSSGL